LATCPTNEADGGGGGEVAKEEDTKGIGGGRGMRRSEVGRERTGGERKNRRKGLINDKLAPYVRGDIEVEIFSFYRR